MRTALLSAIRRNEAGSIRALMPLAGRSVLGWQIDFVLSMKCERIICLCDEPRPDILALQREVEGEGGEFHLVRNNMQLVALLRTDDQLVMLLDGLVPHSLDPAFLGGAGERLRPQVHAIPADFDAAQRSADDFERIDAQRRWAGFAVVNSSTVQKLADCPPDGEAMSLLLRLALQEGATCKTPSPEAATNSELVLASSQEILKLHEKKLLEHGSGSLAWAGPLDGLALWAARAIVQSGTAVRDWTMLLAAFLSILAASVLLWFDYSTAGLLSVAAAALVSRIVVSIARIRARLRPRSKRARYLRYVGPALDIAMIAALIAALGPLNSGLERIALPVFAVGLAQIAGRAGGKIARAFWSDRTLHLLGFAAAAFTGFLAPALAVFGLGALGYKLLRDLKK